ncbi:disease resistance protein RUN1-like [Cornus florida]|uniref:disease resistance protein RUN1-like n=1 Tax=Cornus florida TaxID=4283 RepID=UPI0028990F6D|nr:disease resistance protein RUN1-like [Cornus florida]
MELDDVRSIGLWGMRGIGKTTIAEAVYDRISHRFDDRCFLANVREFSKNKGLEALQERLLSEILKGSNIKITSVGRGVNMIKSRLCHRRILIVVDDVDQLEQLEALGKNDGFGSGSRIIITTRDEHLLTTYGVTKIYNVKELNYGEAMQLLSWKAFKQSFPSEDYLELANQIVDYTSGLPLALKILGSFLFGRTMDEWRCTLRKLHKIPNTKVLEVLKISFDGLDEMEKEIFLDIACFFDRKKKDFVTRILDSCGFYPEIGICVLIQKSFITVSENLLVMHDLIKDMGWYIVDQESPEEAGKRSRLWRPKDIRSVLAENMGTEKVNGIVLELVKEEDITFSIESFTKMNKLRLLIFHNVLFSRGPAHLSNELKCLDWHAYPSSYLPTSFQAENLVELKMCYSGIVQLWKEIKLLDKLKHIDLSHSRKLQRTPDFTKVPNLETLILEDCTSLVEVHPSLGGLKRLVFLSLRNCTNLKRFPSSIHLESLETLNMSGCLKLEKFPEILGDMVCLSELYMDRTAIKELPSSIEHLTSLTSINLSECKNLASLPRTICRLSCLKTLYLSGCLQFEELPDDLGNIKCLEELHVRKTAIKRLPSSISLLKDLKVLSVGRCKGTISESPFFSLVSSWFLQRKCEDSLCLVLPSLAGLYSLTKLDLSDCNLSEGGIPSDLDSLSSLREMNLSRNNFVSLPASIARLSKLQTLVLVGCERLEALPELPPRIENLFADDCQSLISIGDPYETFGRLQRVTFTNCFKLLENKIWSEDLFETWLKYLMLQEEIIFPPFSILLPGSDIPEWFSHQSFGTKLSLELPPDLLNETLIGIGVCGVCDFATANSQTFPEKRTEDLLIQIDVKYLNAELSSVAGWIQAGTNVDSEHILLCFFPVPMNPTTYQVDVRCSVASVHPSIPQELWPDSDEILYTELEMKWGVRLVYERDFESYQDGCGNSGIVDGLDSDEAPILEDKIIPQDHYYVPTLQRPEEHSCPVM